MIQKYRNSGFTLVELMLAMAFVGMLLVAIATTALHIMNTYTKGLTVREVNQAGRTISEDIQRTIATSVPFKVDPAQTGQPSDELDSRYVIRDGGGRLCTGSYTYAWNYGFTQQLGGGTATNVYNVYADNTEQIRLAKVSDAGGALCTDPGASIEYAKAKELLAAGDRNLAVQKMVVTSSTRDDASAQAIYALDLTISTNDQTQLNPSSTACLPPSEGSGNEDFCAINQFNIIARAGNRSGSL